MPVDFWKGYDYMDDKARLAQLDRASASGAEGISKPTPELDGVSVNVQHSCEHEWISYSRPPLRAVTGRQCKRCKTIEDGLPRSVITDAELDDVSANVCDSVCAAGRKTMIDVWRLSDLAKASGEMTLVYAANRAWHELDRALDAIERGGHRK